MSELTEEQGKAMDLGYLIGQKREKVGLTVDEVVEATHLRSSHITAIEDGAFDQLPGEPYARAYIRRYVEFLELDMDEVMAHYDGAAKPVSKRAFMLPEIFSHETHAHGLFAVSSLVMASICVILWNLSTPVMMAPLVVPFTEFHATESSIMPHRCASGGAAYPPCSWEPTELWYNPTKPDRHLFAADHD